jgi:hypothetical protein
VLLENGLGDIYITRDPHDHQYVRANGTVKRIGICHPVAARHLIFVGNRFLKDYHYPLINPGFWDENMRRISDRFNGPFPVAKVIIKRDCSFNYHCLSIV